MAAGDIMLIKVLNKRALEEGGTIVKRFVFLPVNPYAVSFSIPKVYSEVRVSTPFAYSDSGLGDGFDRDNCQCGDGADFAFCEGV
jgi:hypothetical protein